MVETANGDPLAHATAAGYSRDVRTKRGQIRDGVVVLDDPTDAPNGTRVTVVIDPSQDSVTVSDDELRVIDAGLAEARGVERMDARAFVRALRDGH
jgi:hypothetical protein